MQHWSLAEYHLWKRGLVVEALAQAGLIAPVEPLIDAHGARPPARGAACAARARTTCWRSASPRRARTTSSPSTAARCWRRPRRRDRGGLGDRRDPEARRQAARHPGDRDRYPASMSTCAAPARSRPGAPRARRRRREAQARAHHPPRRTGGADRAAAHADRARSWCRCRRARSCRRPPRAKRRWRGW